jgi:hypothetical protein
MTAIFMPSERMIVVLTCPVKGAGVPVGVDWSLAGDPQEARRKRPIRVSVRKRLIKSSAGHCSINGKRNLAIREGGYTDH